MQEEIDKLKQEFERKRKARVRAEAIVEIQKKNPRFRSLMHAQEVSDGCCTANEPFGGHVATCASMGVSRATEFRLPHPTVRNEIATLHPRALSAQERPSVLNTLTNKIFIDWSPAAVYAALLDERVYKCSTSKM